MISVIIPTYKRNDLLKECLERLKPIKQSLNPSFYEVIVTDDSKDFTAKSFIKENYPWALWTEGPHRGPAANRNHGAKLSKFDWLVFIDDDCLPDENILRNYIDVIRNSDENIGAYEGKIIADREKKRYDEESPLNLTGGHFWTCNVAIKKEIFNRIGGFDENFPFPANEDKDIYLRILDVTKVKFLSSAIVIHPWRRIKSLDICRKRFLSGKYFFSKYPTEKSLYGKLRTFLIFFKNELKQLYRFRFKNGLRFFFLKNWYNFLLIFEK